MTAAAGPTNVVVVGGGIIGIACAHYLSKAGIAVTVIDKGRIGGACSYANCGLICPSHVLPLTEPGAVSDAIRSVFNPGAAFRIKPQLRAGLLRWVFEFARRCTHGKMISAGHQLRSLLESSTSEYRSLFESTQLNVECNEEGLLCVFRSTSGFDRFAKTHELIAKKFGVRADIFSGEQLPALDAALKADLAGAFLYVDDSSLRPDTLIREWQRRLASEGVRFIEQCGLQSVRSTNGQIEAIGTDQGDMTADRYVFATGAWTTQLARQLQCSVPIEPGKGYSVTMNKPASPPKHPMLFPEHHIGVTPFSDGYRIGSMMEFVGFDDSINPKKITQLQESAKPYLETPLGSEIQETWYGWRPMTWDSLPVIGRLPKLRNGLLAAGHNMLGLTLAPVTGRLISELVQEKPTHLEIEALSPERF